MNIIKNLELYLLKFKKDRLTKIKEYLDNYIIKKDKDYFIIIITYNIYKFEKYNRKQKISNK